MTKIQNNRHIVRWNGTTYAFSSPVREAGEKEGCLIVVLEEQEERNVYCYDASMNLLWKIRSCPESIFGKLPEFYIGIDCENKELRVIDFYARWFSVDMKTGRVLEQQN